MKKVLFTTLGGINKSYRTTDYSIDNKIYKNKKFILSALDDYYNFDQIYVLGTVSSMWDAFYEYICISEKINPKEEYFCSINDQCSKATEKTSFNDIDLTYITEILPSKYKLEFLKYGLSQDEMIENMNLLIKLTEQISHDSEIYLDLTHGFRSNAFYMFMIMNYIINIKSSQDNIKGIFYGIHESKITPTPILNLKIFSEISELIKGVHDIKTYGNFYTISNCLSENNNEIKNKLNNFSNSLNINYIGEIKNKINQLNKIKITISETENSLIKMIVPKALDEFIQRFSHIKKDYLFLLEISKWYFEQKKYALSFLTLKESITVFFCENYCGKVDSKLLEETNKKINKIQYSFSNKNYIERMDPAFNDTKKLIDIYVKSRIIRNRIAHSEVNDIESFHDINKIPIYIETLSKIFQHPSVKEYIKNRLNF
ncbi:CRISPR-associated protein, TM1812 family [Cetobacterium ceti]|uniref:CRISPR-associated protein, TM1812 family n=1 Tax=Cetobacterium ceti TaxID=180163 RepID=A0A1T4K4N9_9FUSO|nr:TIGR02221 family CRISPR-associated protein [Cetobacterium ceti]SJZ37372.1 CRISPR-associated protein, TM1812 family [Cetobacterium ceti]